MHMPSGLHRIIVFTVKGRHVKLAFGCAVYRMNVLHVVVTVEPQVVYIAVYVDWKLLNNHVKRSISGMRASLTNPWVKNQAGIHVGLLCCMSSIWRQQMWNRHTKWVLYPSCECAPSVNSPYVAKCNCTIRTLNFVYRWYCLQRILSTLIFSTYPMERRTHSVPCYVGLVSLVWASHWAVPSVLECPDYWPAFFVSITIFVILAGIGLVVLFL